MTIELTKEQVEYLKRLVYADSYIRSESNDQSKEAKVAHETYKLLRGIE